MASADRTHVRLAELVAALSLGIDLGVEFALSGRREVDDMISHHAEMARTPAAELGLPDEQLAV